MDNKLFKAPPEKREVIIYLQTYKGNRIVIKIMKLLKYHYIYSVEEIKSSDENRIFEISIFTDYDFDAIIKNLKCELIDYMKFNFPDNYLFDFKNRRLGFVNSFNVFSDEGFHFEVCHKIKEIRTNGGTNIPINKITL